MEITLQIAGIIIGSILLWTGIKKIDFSKRTSLALSILDIVVLILSVISLGWLGLITVIAVNVISMVAYGGYLSIKLDSILTDASIQGDLPKAELKHVYDRLPHKHDVFKAIQPSDRARMILYLCIRHRDVNEIDAMILPIALLWFVQKPDMATFVSKFDQLLRLWRKSADDAKEIADILAKST